MPGDTDYKNPVRSPEATVDTLSTRISELKELMQTKFEAFTKIIDERDRRYEDRFRAMDEKTSLALTSSEKAVSKAEIATEKRFDGVNEFRGSLNDQANRMIPRAEAETRFAALDSMNEDVKKELGSLRESRSEGSGKEHAETANKAMMFVMGMMALTILGLVFKAFGK